MSMNPGVPLLHRPTMAYDDPRDAPSPHRPWHWDAPAAKPVHTVLKLDSAAQRSGRRRSPSCPSRHEPTGLGTAHGKPSGTSPGRPSNRLGAATAASSGPSASCEPTHARAMTHAAFLAVAGRGSEHDVRAHVHRAALHRVHDHRVRQRGQVPEVPLRRRAAVAARPAAAHALCGGALWPPTVSPLAIFLRMRRMIFPDRVFGSAGTTCEATPSNATTEPLDHTGGTHQTKTPLVTPLAAHAQACSKHPSAACLRQRWHDMGAGCGHARYGLAVAAAGVKSQPLCGSGLQQRVMHASLC
jgi:hypothetical protein